MNITTNYNKFDKMIRTQLPKTFGVWILLMLAIFAISIILKVYFGHERFMSLSVYIFATLLIVGTFVYRIFKDKAMIVKFRQVCIMCETNTINSKFRGKGELSHFCVCKKCGGE